MNATRRRQWDQKRRLRLMSKIQKARVLEYVEEILNQRSWARRFGYTAKLKATRTMK